MKLKGQKIEGPNRETIVLPRSNGEDLVFHAQAVLSFKEFDDVFPEPKPPMLNKPGQAPTPHLTHPDYLSKMADRSGKKLLWMVIKSLVDGTPDMELETVDLADPSTWDNFDQEMQDSGLSQAEVGHIINCVMSSNNLDDTKLQEARNSFLASQVEPESN